MLLAHGADIHAVDAEGRTPLSLAATWKLAANVYLRAPSRFASLLRYEDLVEARTALATARRDARRRVVDLGCGAGRDYPAFEERNIDYLGVDASEGMLTVARERFPSANFEAQDLCALDLPARSFDGAFANASLQHVATCVEIEVAVPARWRGG